MGERLAVPTLASLWLRQLVLHACLSQVALVLLTVPRPTEVATRDAKTGRANPIVVAAVRRRVAPRALGAARVPGRARL